MEEQRVGLGQAWYRVCAAIPPGWDITMLLQVNGLWTAQVEPTTWQAKRRFQWVTGQRATGRHATPARKMQAQGDTPTEALLALAEAVVVNLLGDFWEFDPVRAEPEEDALVSLLEGQA